MAISYDSTLNIMKINRRNYKLERSWSYSFFSCLLGVTILLTAIILGDRFKATLVVNMAILNKLWVMSKVAQSCPTLCDPMDSSLPVFSVHGIFQARILEWVAISFSRGSSQPRDRTRSPALQTDALPSEPPGKP